MPELNPARIPPQTPPAGRIPNLAEFQKTFSQGKAESVSPNFCFRFSESVFVLHSRTFHFEKLCALHRGAQRAGMLVLQAFKIGSDLVV